MYLKHVASNLHKHSAYKVKNEIPYHATLYFTS